MSNEKKESLIYALTKWQLFFLFTYYGILLISGIAIMVFVLIVSPKTNIMGFTIVSSLGSAGAMSSVQYIRRLYNACINNKIYEFQSGIKSIGNFLYFIFRPVFAFAFTMVMIFLLRSGLIFIIDTDVTIINERFLYISVIISAIIGFSPGKVLDKFETLSTKKIEEEFNKLEHRGE